MKKLVIGFILILTLLAGYGNSPAIRALDTSTFMGMLTEMDVACPVEAAAVRNFALSPLFWLVTEYRSNPADVAGLCAKAAAPMDTTQPCLEHYEDRDFFAMALASNLGVGEDFIWMLPLNAFNYIYENNTFDSKIAFMDQPNPCGTVPLPGPECTADTLAAPTMLTPANGATVSGSPVFTWSLGACSPELVLLMKAGPLSLDPLHGTIHYTLPNETSWSPGQSYLDYCGETYKWWMVSKSVDGATAQTDEWTYTLGDEDCSPLPDAEPDSPPDSPSGLRILGMRDLLAVSQMDTDGDGIQDAFDRCPDVPGPALGRGCPVEFNRCQVEANRRDIIVRVGPGPDRGAFGNLAPLGSWFNVVGSAQASDGSGWWKLDRSQIAGGANANSLWVSQADVTSRGPCAFVREVVASPTIYRPAAPATTGWGACGSCSTCMGPAEQCVTSPEGQCLWDTSCAAGEDGPAIPGCYSVRTSVVATGGASGSVRIMTPRNCEGRTFQAGTVVTFEAVASSGTFTGWSGCGLSGRTPVVSAPINSSCVATATFSMN